MLGRYAVSIEGKTRTVELDDDGEGGCTVVVDGNPRKVDIRALGDGVWSLIEGTATRLVQVDGTGSKLTVEVSHVDGEPRLCVAEVVGGGIPSTEGGGNPVASGPLRVRAPIPGRVVKVLVKRGDTVKAGQTLLVLEAMKMENELRAPRAGVVSAVEASEGVAVESGQALVSLD